MFKRNSIKFKLIFIMVLTVLGFMILLTSFQVYSNFRLETKIEQRGFDAIDKILSVNYEKNILGFEQHFKLDIATIATILGYDLYNLDKKGIDLKLKNYLNYKELCKISVINALDKKVFSSQINPLINNEKCKRFEQPIIYNNKIIGNVIAYYSLEKVKKKFEKNKNIFKSNIDNIKNDVHKISLESIYFQVLFSFLILTLLIVFIIRHINRSIIQPINKLLNDMENIKEGSLEDLHDIESDQDDEIGKLYNYFYMHITTLLKKLNHRANYDSLTKLYSRQKLLNDVENLDDFNLCLLDINKFKEFNNFLGIQAGDEIIKKTASFLLDFFDQFNYQIYRFNGDEFAILDISHKSIDVFEYDIRTFINHTAKREFIINNETVNISLCAGITNCKDSSPLVAATTALKHSKQEKLDLVVYDLSLPIIKEFEKNFHTTKLIRKAIDKNLIIPYFQPIKDIKKDKIEKYEALIRIKDHHGTIHLPNTFLAVSHKSGLYRELSLKMIRNSTKIFKYKDLTLTINLSTKDIRDQKVLKLIDKLKTERKALENIVFEITEQDGIDNFEEVQVFINDIKKYGGKIAIDDFGSGYSNFENVIHLGIDFLKIDGSLIKNITRDRNSKIIVETIVDFAKKLHIQTVAEYVSDEEIYNTVKDMGIDFAQGYYIGKPSDKLLQ